MRGLRKRIDGPAQGQRCKTNPDFSSTQKVYPAAPEHLRQEKKRTTSRGKTAETRNRFFGSASRHALSESDTGGADPITLRACAQPACPRFLRQQCPGSSPDHASMPPERLATFRCNPAIKAGVPPLFSSSRKSERCTATRLIEPSASTSTAFQPEAVLRIT
jgi:hypothetical protein